MAAGSIDSVLRLLTVWQRHDLVDLLKRGRMEFDVSNTWGSRLYSQITTAEVYAPVEDCERLRALSAQDHELILKALCEIHPPRDNDIEITSLVFFVDPLTPTLGVLTNDELVLEVEAQRSLMIAVATGGPRIQAVNPEYQERRERIGEALVRRGLADPNPYEDLWAWYGKWSSGDLPTYDSRRKYLHGLYEPLLNHLRNPGRRPSTGVFDEPTGWVKVDRTLGEIRRRLEEASTEEQYQAVGLLCRENLISLAQTVYDPVRHPSLDGTPPSATDAKRMLEAYVAAELGGSENEALRRHARAAFDLANAVQHKRTATFREAALCAEATSSAVNLVAIVSGQRDP